MRELAELRGYFAALADVARADDLKVKPRRDYRRDAKLEGAR